MESEADPSIRPVNLAEHLNVLMKGKQIRVVELLYILPEPLAEFHAQRRIDLHVNGCDGASNGRCA